MKKAYAIVMLVFAALLFFGCEDISAPDGRLQVHYIDVGQGDSTLVISPSGRSMIIDAGDNSSYEVIRPYLKKHGVQKIDLLIGTHPDADHIGGIDDIIENHDIGKFYMPNKLHTTKTFGDVLLAAKQRNLGITQAIEGKTMDFDPEVQVVLLSPEKEKNYGDDNNAYSAVIYMVYKDTSFLFMGDAVYENEADILENYPNLTADVIKLGHHGSASSSSPEFINQIKPLAATVSCGYKNRYSHPHKEVLELLESSEIPLYRTDEQGNIVFRSDGESITADKEPGSYTYRRN